MIERPASEYQGTTKGIEVGDWVTRIPGNFDAHWKLSWEYPEDANLVTEVRPDHVGNSWIYLEDGNDQAWDADKFAIVDEPKADLYDTIIDRPEHYTKFSIEPITFIMRNDIEFWRGNVIKYAARAGSKLYPGKDHYESEILDLKKSIRYCEMRINQLNGEIEL